MNETEETKVIPDDGAVDTAKPSLLEETKDMDQDFMPADPSKYQLVITKEYLKRDEAVNALLYENGFTNRQVQLVYDLAAERLFGIVREVQDAYEKRHEQERLIEYFGGEDRYDEVVRQITAFADKNLKPEVMANLSSTFDGVLALYRMAQDKEPSLTRGKAAPVGEMTEQDLKKIMMSNAYWVEKKPEVVRQVQDGFKRLYG